MPEAIRCLIHPAASGARNMAVDEALMASARAGGVTLRFYRWDPPCLSLGRNQSARGRYDREEAEREGIEFVRRPTGGRAVLHHREVTYAVAAPAELWGGLRPSYRRVNRALLRGLVRLGAEVEEASREGRTPGPSSRACFRDPLPGEIVARGRKLVGSAQWREEGALLQHGSLLLRDDQGTVDRLRRDGGPVGGPAPDAAPADGRSASAASLSDLLPGVPAPERLVQALRQGFEEEFDLPVREGELQAVEEARARELEGRYRSPEWTWRR